MTNPVNPFPYTTLGGNITSGSASATVASTANFPQAGTFTVSIDSELITGCSVTNATTIALGTRGASGGGSAASHSTNAVVFFVGNLSSVFMDSGKNFTRADYWAGPEALQPLSTGTGTLGTIADARSLDKKTYLFKNTTDQTQTITLVPMWDSTNTQDVNGYQLNTATGGGSTFQVALTAGNVTPTYGILTLSDYYPYVAVNSKAGGVVTTGFLYCRMLSTGR